MSARPRITITYGQLIWSRKAAGRFPEAKEIKQKVRDGVAPDRHLGHSDR